MRRVSKTFIDGWRDDCTEEYLLAETDPQGVPEEVWRRYEAARATYEAACLELRDALEPCPLSEPERKRAQAILDEIVSDYAEMVIRGQANCDHMDDYGTMFDPDSAICMDCGARDPLRVELVLAPGDGRETST